MSKDSRQLNFVGKGYQRYNWFTWELLQESYSTRNDERNLVQKQKSKFEIPQAIFWLTHNFPSAEWHWCWSTYWKTFLETFQNEVT